MFLKILEIIGVACYIAFAILAIFVPISYLDNHPWLFWLPIKLGFGVYFTEWVYRYFTKKKNKDDDDGAPNDILADIDDIAHSK